LIYLTDENYFYSKRYGKRRVASPDSQRIRPAFGYYKENRKKAELYSDLQEAIREVKKGKLTGPFTSVKELRLSLEK